MRHIHYQRYCRQHVIAAIFALSILGVFIAIHWKGERILIAGGHGRQDEGRAVGTHSDLEVRVLLATRPCVFHS